MSPLSFTWGRSTCPMMGERPAQFEDVSLDLVEIRIFGSRVIYERFRPARGTSGQRNM
jgi:hypothetical protein